jgi:cytoskeletal protein CcmA (bactofilin family)
VQSEPTIIGADCAVHGTFTSGGDVFVYGRLQGAIEAAGTVRVFETGVVLADIMGAVVRVEGVVEGRVRATERVSIGPRGRLHGDVEGVLSVDDGGLFQGNVTAPQRAVPIRRRPVTPRRVYNDAPPRAPTTDAISSISESDISDALFQMSADPAPSVSRTAETVPKARRRLLRVPARHRGKTDPGVNRPPGATITAAVVPALTSGSIEAALQRRSEETSEEPAVKHTGEMPLLPDAPPGSKPGVLVDAWFQEDDDLID